MKITTIILITFIFIIILGSLWLWTPDKTRMDLEQIYLSDKDDMMNVNNTWLHVRDEGKREAPAVIMIHGFGASLHTWDPWTQELLQDYRVIRLDLPGSGLSAPDANNDYSDTRSIELLLKIMDKKNIDKAVFMGNSIGGRIAWRMASDHPDRVKKLVLIAPDGFASPGFEYGKPPEIPMLMNVMRYALPKPILRANLKQSYGNPENLLESNVDRYYDLLLAPGSRQAMLERLKQTVLINPHESLKSIESPVLLMWGEKDALIPVSNAQDYLNLLSHSRLVSFPELGHVPHEEAPQTTFPAVAKFLSEP
jgi:pimeloyl-ACP methyl ester carboxylesterase